MDGKERMDAYPVPCSHECTKLLRTNRFHKDNSANQIPHAFDISSQVPLDKGPTNGFKRLLIATISILPVGLKVDFKNLIAEYVELLPWAFLNVPMPFFICFLLERSGYSS